MNPRQEVVEKLVASHFVDTIGRESLFLTLDDAVAASQNSLQKTKKISDQAPDNV